MNDLLVARIAKRCGPLGFRPKIIAAHLACRPTGAAEGRRIFLSICRLVDFKTASAPSARRLPPSRGLFRQGERDREGAARRLGARKPAHEVTRANDFRSLTALSRNLLTPTPSS